MGEERTGEPLDVPQANQRLTVAQAANALGITEGAVRSRIKRGTLPTVKEGGTVYVVLADGTSEANQSTNTGEPSDEPSDQTAARPDPREELIESLLDQVAYMREQLAEEREARRRADTIIAQLTQANAVLAGRVPEIEAPRDEPHDPESASEGEGRGDVPPEPQESGERRSWWQRLFGE